MHSGILDRTRLVANVLMLILVGMNIYFSTQYSAEVERNGVLAEAQSVDQRTRLANAKFINLFVDKVLATEGVVSFDDRVKLENDIRGLNDPKAFELWNAFVNSADSAEAQEHAVKLLSHLSFGMI